MPIYVDLDFFLVIIVLVRDIRNGQQQQGRQEPQGNELNQVKEHKVANRIKKNGNAYWPKKQREFKMKWKCMKNTATTVLWRCWQTWMVKKKILDNFHNRMTCISTSWFSIFYICSHWKFMIFDLYASVQFDFIHFVCEPGLVFFSLVEFSIFRFNKAVKRPIRSTAQMQTETAQCAHALAYSMNYSSDRNWSNSNQSSINQVPNFSTKWLLCIECTFRSTINGFVPFFSLSNIFTVLSYAWDAPGMRINEINFSNNNKKNLY